MKKDYDKILKRLITILSKIHMDEKPTITELAIEFNVSKRTIQYDVYDRLGSFPIIKDTEGRLIFSNNYSLIN